MGDISILTPSPPLSLFVNFWKPTRPPHPPKDKYFIKICIKKFNYQAL